MMKKNEKRKNSTMKKLIPAAGMLALSASMLATSTYAWFTMNKEVAVTGMQVNTTVGSNLLISHDTLTAADANAENTFKTSDITTVSGKLEPVSTIDGVNYFYTANTNVLGSGDAISDAYIAYNPASTDAFNSNYGTTGAVGYIDYCFELKANAATSGTNEYINVTDLQLTYGGTSSDKAFRVAYFVQDLGTAHSADNGGVGTLKTILKDSSAANFTTNSAIKTTSTLDTVTAANTAATLAEVTGGTTNYYRVVVRLWIEGEDTTCNNTTFNTLTGEWGLNMTIKMETATTAAVNALTLNYGAVVDLSDDSASATSVVIDGVTYYQLSTNSTYYTTDGTFASTSRVYQYNGTNNHMYDVTNKVKRPTA